MHFQVEKKTIEQWINHATMRMTGTEWEIVKQRECDTYCFLLLPLLFFFFEILKYKEN